MNSIQTYRNQWFLNPRQDILSGLVVALALIPEAIAFSVIAGVDPQVGLYASFSMAVVIAFMGGRPAMISAATAAMALLMVTLVKNHGLEYLFAATILTGIFQILAGYLKLAKLMRFVSKSVVIGFVNALAILIFMAQLSEIGHMSNTVIGLMLLGLAVIYLFPYIPKLGQLIPAPLFSLVLISILVFVLNIDARTVADLGQMPSSLPLFFLPDIPLNWHTFEIIFPYAFALAAVGLLESMMTATIVDEITDSDSDKHQECKGQGIANIVTGCMGGMAGCAMIGQSMINVKSGARGRLSTFVAGIFLLILVVFLSDLLAYIPMAALVAIMIMVSISTFEWRSLNDLRHQPNTSSIVMLATVAVVVATHNLAYGVMVGVILSALFLANKLENDVRVESQLSGQCRLYVLYGQLFFSSSERFMKAFDFNEAVAEVHIDLTHAHVWDITSVSKLDSVVEKFSKKGIKCNMVGLNEASSLMIEKYGTHCKI